MAPDNPSEIPEGDRITWLYDQRDGTLGAYFRRRVSNTQDAEDLRSETYARIIESGELATARDPRALIFGYARLVFLEYRREALQRKRLANDFALLSVVEEPPTPDDHLLQGERIARARKALAALPGMMGKILFYTTIHGKSREETAALCGISESEVRYLLPIARTRLGNILALTSGRESDATHRR